jgi:hemerythrin-like metal-binding protein
MAELFKWEPRYQLGVPAMDVEHQQLIGLMNALHAKYEAQASIAEQTAAFGALAAFVVKHFADEEAHMAKVGFPGLESHKLIHKSLLQKVGEFGARAEQAKQFPPELFAFLRQWLAAHIMGIDAKYAEHTKAKLLSRAS